MSASLKKFSKAICANAACCKQMRLPARSQSWTGYERYNHLCVFVVIVDQG